ncbi:MAG: hypothetical protein J7L47_02730 [Candidatus Odinarchaeota archaeon]|nr:hypothetical protein [Candidatus Odinarchaeota archaeon]
MSKAVSSKEGTGREFCPYLEIRKDPNETSYICTVQGVRMSKMDVSVLCKSRSAWKNCYAYLFAKDLMKGKRRVETLSDAEFEPIKQQLMSNIELDLWDIAKQLNVLPQVVRQTIEEYNKKQLIGIVTSNKIIPARTFIESIRADVNASNPARVKESAEKYGLEISRFTKSLLMLIERGYL